MLSTRNTYLDRLAARTALFTLKRQIAFGLAVSTILLVVGAWKYLVVVGANDALWLFLFGIGAGGLLLARTLPTAWSLPERAASRLFQTVGSWLFATALTILYFAIVTPVGLAMRRSRGPGVSRWTRAAPASRSTWEVKQSPAGSSVRQSSRSLLESFLFVLQYFHSRRQYVLLPFLVIVLAFGLLLFFVKSSALAPFIYTLF
jgi:hypothetical protein